MIGVKTLTIGYTKDIKLAEKIARATGAKELIIETRPEGDTLMLNAKEQGKWRKRGWRLEGRKAKKTLMANIVEDHSGNGTEEERRSEMQRGPTREGYSGGGRLKASMLFETANEGSSGVEDDSSKGSSGVEDDSSSVQDDDDWADDEKNEHSEETSDDTKT